MRAALVLALASVAAAVAPPLHADPNLACSGCEIVTSLVGAMLLNPPAKFKERTVSVKDAQGETVERPFTDTVMYFNMTVTAACSSEKYMRRYGVVADLWGRRRFAERRTPVYETSAPLPPQAAELQRICRTLEAQRLSELLVAHAKGELAGACGPRHLRTCEPEPSTLGEHAASVLRTWTADPAGAMRVLPLVVAAGALPFMLASLRGPPELVGAAAEEEDEPEPTPRATVTPPTPPSTKKKGKQRK